MKKILFFIVFMGFSIGFSGNLKAQVAREQLSTNQKSDDNLIVAYPNPTTDYLVIKTKDASVKIKNVAFYSILGTQVASYPINMNAAEINIERLRPGKYLMRYTLSDNTQKVKQIIKQ